MDLYLAALLSPAAFHILFRCHDARRSFKHRDLERGMICCSA
jgi:hypothetical protein